MKIQNGKPKMGRKPIPTYLKILKGNPGKRPLPLGEPFPTEPLGPPPADFLPAAKVLWAEVVNAIPRGVATKSDTLFVELTVRLLIQMRLERANLSPSMAAQIRNCLGQLGMTPCDRARFAAPPRVDDEETKYLRRGLPD
jgi:hypothetical protein